MVLAEQRHEYHLYRRPGGSGDVWSDRDNQPAFNGISAAPASLWVFGCTRRTTGPAAPARPEAFGSPHPAGERERKDAFDFTNAPTQFHQLHIAVDSVANTFHVFDLDTQTALTDASGSSGTQSWAAEIDGKGGYHIGSISGSNTTLTNYELDYFRVLLGVAVDSATTSIRTIGQCHTVAFDSDGDNDVDMTDFGGFPELLHGRQQPLHDQCVPMLRLEQ